jgi:hypothetical protein
MYCKETRSAKRACYSVRRGIRVVVRLNNPVGPVKLLCWTLLSRRWTLKQVIALREMKFLQMLGNFLSSSDQPVVDRSR